MSCKILFTCASALFVQSAFGQCYSRIAEPMSAYRTGLAYEAYPPARSARFGCGYPAVDISVASSLNAAHGGGLAVSSASTTAPTGLAVNSENVYEGPVAVAGSLPFLGTAAVEGAYQSVGAGAIAFDCGDGAVGIVSESPVSATDIPEIIGPAALDIASFGYKGTPARGCGCSVSYI